MICTTSMLYFVKYVGTNLRSCFFFLLLLLFLCFEFGDYFILLPRDLFINGGNSHLFDLYRFLYLYIAPYYIPFSMLGVLSCLCWFCVAAAHRVWHPTLTSWHLFSPFEVEKNFEVLKMEVHLYGSPFFVLDIFICIFLSLMIPEENTFREPSIMNLYSLSCMEIINLDPISTNTQ